jgi:hypothetical protein
MLKPCCGPADKSMLWSYFDYVVTIACNHCLLPLVRVTAELRALPEVVARFEAWQKAHDMEVLDGARVSE